MINEHKDVVKMAGEHNVKFIRLQFPDIFGNLKNIAITVSDLNLALQGGIGANSFAINSYLRAREQDIILKPDPDTFALFPWRPREGAVGRLICDVYQPDGQPFPGCSRNILKEAAQEASRLGLQITTACEIEFYLIQPDDGEKLTPATQDQAGICDLSPHDQGENVRRDIVLILEEMGLEISSSHHGAGPGQHRIGIKPRPVLRTADNIVTSKFVIQTVAQRHGLWATFMPKPLAHAQGSSLELKLHLHSEDRDAALTIEDQPARRFAAGILQHARAISALANPTVNSYKRLSEVGGPQFAAWSSNDRRAMIKLPAQTAGATFEIRNPDPLCNPYLTLAAILKAGISGLTDKSELPGPLEETAAPRPLPRQLNEALNELQADPVIRSAIGPYIFDRWLKTKAAEWEEYEREIHPWEWKRYLR